MDEAPRLPLGLGIVVGAVVVGAATLLPWRAAVGIGGLGGQVTLVLAVALGLIGVLAIRDPSDRGIWLAALGLASLMLVVAVGYATSDAGLVPVACDDVASCAYREMVPAGMGIGLVSVIVGCLIAASTALVGAHRRPVPPNGERLWES